MLAGFDFSEFDEECKDLEAKKAREIEEEIQRRINKISQPLSALDPLPSQEIGSLALHSAIVEAYAKSHQFNPKKEFVSRKIKAKLSRKSKSAEEYLDKSSKKQQAEAERKKKIKNMRK